MKYQPRLFNIILVLVTLHCSQRGTSQFFPGDTTQKVNFDMTFTLKTDFGLGAHPHTFKSDSARIPFHLKFALRPMAIFNTKGTGLYLESGLSYTMLNPGKSPVFGVPTMAGAQLGLSDKRVLVLFAGAGGNWVFSNPHNKVNTTFMPYYEFGLWVDIQFPEFNAPPSGPRGMVLPMKFSIGLFQNTQMIGIGI